MTYAHKITLDDIESVTVNNALDGIVDKEHRDQLCNILEKQYLPNVFKNMKLKFMDPARSSRITKIQSGNGKHQMRHSFNGITSRDVNWMKREIGGRNASEYHRKALQFISESVCSGFKFQKLISYDCVIIIRPEDDTQPTLYVTAGHGTNVLSISHNEGNNGYKQTFENRSYTVWTIDGFTYALSLAPALFQQLPAPVRSAITAVWNFFSHYLPLETSGQQS